MNEGLARRVRTATALWAVMAFETHHGEEYTEDGVTYQHTNNSVSVLFWCLTEEHADKLIKDLRRGKGPESVGGWTKNTVWRKQEMLYPIPLDDDRAAELCEMFSVAWAERYIATKGVP